MVGRHPGPQLRRLSRPGAARGGGPAGGPGRRRDHRRGRHLQRRPGVGGRATGIRPGLSTGRIRGISAQSGHSTGASSSLRVSWCTYYTATTLSCPASTPPWNKHSQIRRRSPRSAASETSMPTTHRPTSPGPTERGPASGRTRSTPSRCRTGSGHRGSWSAARRTSESAATGPTCRTQPTGRCGPDSRRTAPSCSWTRCSPAIGGTTPRTPSARVATGANVRERVTAIGVVGGHVPPNRRARTTRRALAYSVVFATRTALSLARAGKWSAAGRQGREAVRCAWLLPRGVPVHPQPDPAFR